MNWNSRWSNGSPPIVTPSSPQCVKSICASRPGGCFCSKYTSRSGPCSARQSLIRRCNVRRCDLPNRPGCRPSSHSRTVGALSTPSMSARSSGSMSCSHTPASGSGLVLCLRISFFFSDGSGPLLQFRTDLSLIPDAAPAACCVLPFISFCLINTTCRSVINLLTSCEGDNHLYQPANSSVVTSKSYCRVSETRICPAL